ncbi:MAG: YfdX family protein [Cyanobacteria bacterium J06588_4]
MVVFFGITAIPSYAASSQVASKSLKEKIEQVKEEATAEARDIIDSEAVAAVEETNKAIALLGTDNTSEAIEALERSTGKLDILLARNPKLAFIPLSSAVEVIDVAPQNDRVLKEFRNRLKSAIDNDNYPEAREILDNMISEVRTKTVNLPLASYPEAMRKAAQLIENEQPELAKSVLQAALSTLVITEKNRPIPIINAQTELAIAMDLSQTDKDAALKLMENARRDLKLAQDFGYASGDREYAKLGKIINKIENKIESNSDVASAFSDLQSKIMDLLQRASA